PLRGGPAGEPGRRPGEAEPSSDLQAPLCPHVARDERGTVGGALIREESRPGAAEHLVERAPVPGERAPGRLELRSDERYREARTVQREERWVVERELAADAGSARGRGLDAHRSAQVEAPDRADARNREPRPASGCRQRRGALDGGRRA